MLNPDDDEALKRAIKYPSKGIGDTTMTKLQDAARANQVSLWAVLSNPIAYALSVNNGTLNKLAAFYQMISDLQAKVNQLSVYDFTQMLLQVSGINADLLKESGVEGISHRENVQSLLAGMHEFTQTRLEEGIEDCSMAAYLSEVALNTDQDEEDNDDKVFLMTVHASKGLEFNNVFVTGMEENIFPSQRSSESQAELEEERRLLYVAITRAGNRCALTFAKSRFRNGNTEFSRPSRFLRELDPRLIEQGSASISGSYGSSPFGNSSYGSSPFGNRTQSSYSGNSSSYGSRPSSSPMNLQRKAAYPGSSQSRPSTSTTSASSSFSSIENPRAWKKMPTQASVSTTATTPAAAAQAIQSSKGTFVVGQKVLHDRFGEGLIKSIEGQGDNCKIGVEFVHAGFKMLLLKFASMRPID
ncbi:MAG: ATP-binding domain-containing protein [Bacteroidales bacterium]|nr:ATP-binding domain-containing protein [Bacteroidales bacterium]